MPKLERERRRELARTQLQITVFYNDKLAAGSKWLNLNSFSLQFVKTFRLEVCLMLNFLFLLWKWLRSLRSLIPLLWLSRKGKRLAMRKSFVRCKSPFLIGITPRISWMKSNLKAEGLLLIATKLNIFENFREQNNINGKLLCLAQWLESLNADRKHSAHSSTVKVEYLENYKYH